MSSQLYFVILCLSCSIICHRSKYKLNFSIRSMSNSQLFNNHHGSHALFSFISLDSKCIPYVFLLYYPVYNFFDFNKSSLKNIYIYIYRIPLFSLAEEWGRGRKLMACVTPIGYYSDGSSVGS